MDPQDIGKILDEIGQRIGPAGEAAWQAAVAYKRAGAISAFATVIVAALISGSVWSYSQGKADYSGDGDFWAWASIVSGTVAVVSIVALIAVTATNLPNLIVPEGGVIQDLLRAAP